jgi:sodium/potassium-transporting ATPase subunit alpha
MSNFQKGKNSQIQAKLDLDDHGSLMDDHHLNSDKNDQITSPAHVDINVDPSSTKDSGKGSPTYEEPHLSIDEVALRYNTNVNCSNPIRSRGLTQDQVKAARLIYGRNVLNPPKSTPGIVLFIKKLVGLMNILLILAGVLSFILYGLDPEVMDNLSLGILLVAVALLNAFIDFYQEHKTGSLLKSFIKLIPENSTVIREGIQQELPASDLVPGDIIILKNGCKIPADIRLIFLKGNVKVDNSSLTGESEPQERSLIAYNDKPQEAQNLVFNGTLLVSGDGMGIVIRIGNNSMLGGVANLTVGEKKRESRMTKEIDHFVFVLAGFAFVIAACLFGYGFSRTSDISINFGFAISIFSAFVPQGLPGTVTMLLTIGAKKMVKKNALVKDLQGVETLGSITMLCSDKTGTLTQNKMSVVGSWINGELLSAYDVLHEYYDPDENKETMNDQKHLKNLMDIMRTSVLCSNSRYDENDRGKPSIERKVYGDATEVGLLRYASNKIDVFSVSEDYPKVFEIPFNSETKWHLTVNKLPHKEGKYQILVKGAPEKVLEMCSHIKIFDREVDITAQRRADFQKAYEHYAGQGNRVLGFASLKLNAKDFPLDYEFTDDPSFNFPTSGLVLLGLQSLRDPPKKGVKSAVVALRQAGVQVVMVTGDHPLTAVAIAKQVGIVVGHTKEQAALVLKKDVEEVKENEYDVAVIKGDQVDQMKPQD